MNSLIVLIGKTILLFSRILNLGSGSTWPGHVALKLDADFIEHTLNKSRLKIILVTGTNGKTTTVKLLQSILEKAGKKIFVNFSGANLTNGVASSIIQKSDLKGKLNYEYAIFEIDENTLPLVIKQLKPDYLIALNLFRDQLDRYGEVNSIAKMWKSNYNKLYKTKYILNADDPQIAYLGSGILSKVYYFGLNDQKYQTHQVQHAADSVLCPSCGQRLDFKRVYFSHLGIWKCPKCGLSRPPLDIEKTKFYPLKGTYAVYDTLAAVLTAKIIGINENVIEHALTDFKPAFGRQEEVTLDGKKIQLFLSKNPTSFNESLKTISEQNPKNLLIVLNDRIPDGTDISWIWDVEFEMLTNKHIKLFLAGDRVYDLALRLKYSLKRNGKAYSVFENLNEAVKIAVSQTAPNHKLYILPTYSAMLEVRGILTGKKIS